jgi:hypothetical protein
MDLIVSLCRGKMDYKRNVQHIIDRCRYFLATLPFIISRNDTTPLAGFDENGM